MELLDRYFFVNYHYSYRKVRSYRTVSAVADIALLQTAVSMLLVKLIVERLDLHFYQQLKGVAMISFYIAFLLFGRLYFDRNRLIHIHRKYRGVDMKRWNALIWFVKVAAAIFVLWPWEMRS